MIYLSYQLIIFKLLHWTVGYRQFTGLLLSVVERLWPESICLFHWRVKTALLHCPSLHGAWQFKLFKDFINITHLAADRISIHRPKHIQWLSRDRKEDKLSMMNAAFIAAQSAACEGNLAASMQTGCILMLDVKSHLHKHFLWALSIFPKSLNTELL